MDSFSSGELTPFGMKSVAILRFTMVTRPLYNTPDMGVQGEILRKVADLGDAERVRTTATDLTCGINAESLRKAQASKESGGTRGKLVLKGF